MDIDCAWQGLLRRNHSIHRGERVVVYEVPNYVLEYPHLATEAYHECRPQQDALFPEAEDLEENEHNCEDQWPQGSMQAHLNVDALGVHAPFENCDAEEHKYAEEESLHEQTNRVSVPRKDTLVFMLI